MALIGSIVIGTRVNTDGISKGLKESSQQLKSFSVEVKNLSAKLGDSGGMFAGLAGGIAGGAGVTAVFEGLKKAVSLNSEFVSSVSRSNAVLGDEAKLIQDSAKQFGELGVKQSDYIGTASSFAAVFKNTGSTAKEAARLGNELTKVGLNLSAFADKDPEQAFTALQAALRGEFDPLEQFNVFLKADAIAVEAVAMGLAKSTKEVSENAKKQASLNLILKQSADANGALGKEAGETGSRIRALSGSIDNTFTNIGNAIDPIVNKVLEISQVGFSVLTDTLKANAEVWKTWSADSVSSGGAVEGVAVAVAGAFGVIADVIQAVKIAWKFATAAIQVQLGGLIDQLALVGKAIDGTLSWFGKDETGLGKQLDVLSQGFKQAAGDSFKDAMDTLAAPPPSEGINRFFDNLKQRLEETKKEAADTKTKLESTVTAPDAEKAAKRLESLQKEAKNLTKSLRKPTEIMHDEMAKAGELFSAGLISSETFDRSLIKSFTEESKARGPFKFAGANEIGSTNFRSMFLAAQFGSSNPERKAEQLAQTQIGWLRNMADQLGQIRRNTALKGDDEAVDI